MLATAWCLWKTQTGRDGPRLVIVSTQGVIVAVGGRGKFTSSSQSTDRLEWLEWLTNYWHSTYTWFQSCWTLWHVVSNIELGDSKYILIPYYVHIGILYNVWYNNLQMININISIVDLYYQRLEVRHPAHCSQARLVLGQLETITDLGGCVFNQLYIIPVPLKYENINVNMNKSKFCWCF